LQRRCWIGLETVLIAKPPALQAWNERCLRTWLAACTKSV
jgi:hypothetical protein